MYLRMIEDMLDHSMLMLHELEGIFFFYCLNVPIETQINPTSELV